MNFFYGRLTILCLAFIQFIANAQVEVGNYQSGFKKEGNVISLSCQSADVRLEFCTPQVVRIRTSWTRSFVANETWMVVQYNWPAITIQSEEQAEHFLITTDSLKITINKFPFSLSISTHDGKILTSEKIDGVKAGPQQIGDIVSCRKQLMPDEHFFGFGERMDFLDQRGRQVRLNVGRGTGMPHIIGAYNILEANYCPVPFFMSTKGYGIFFHTAYPTTWDMGASLPGSYSFGAEGGELDYYFMHGPDFPTLLRHYTSLTGRAPLMSLFALGLHVGTYSGGTWGYEHLTSDQYVIALARKFRELGIPIDILHLDSTWRIFGENGGKGATSFEWRETFKNPKGMFDSLYAMKYNMVGVHLRPRFDNGKTLRLLDKAREKGYTYPEANSPGEFVNFFDSNAVDWWWENGVMKVASLGAKFLKTDEGSAFGHKANESDKTGPTGQEIKQLHNIFPLAYAKAPYEKFQAFNNMRGMNHTREGYAGIQRYPFIFAGDWPSEWQYFAPVIKAGLNIGMSGVGNWAHCMGGFEHPADPELYIRWCQFGLLSPIAHLFGMDHPGYKEPWNYGDEALRIFKEYDKLRYRLIPYLYSHSYEMYQTGMPIMRALVLEHQNDQNVYDVADQYMFGKYMMVCPVTVKAAQTRVVYIPEGTWIDYWTGKIYQGKKYYNVVTPLDKLPIFIKGGAIIPMQPEVTYIDMKPWKEITLDIFPEGKSEFDLYEDDGVSLQYLQGKYATTKVECNDLRETTQITITPTKGDHTVPGRIYALKVHTKSAPSDVVLTINKKKQKIVRSYQASDPKSKIIGWYYDDKSNLLWVKTYKDPKSNLQVQIVK